MTFELVTSGLAVLTVVDFLLTTWILLVPRSFLNTLHGSTVPLDRPLTRRTGGFWLGFTLLQGATLVLWPAYPGLLLLVAGVRFTEGVADWLFLTGPNSFTGMGRVGYTLSVPYTLGFGFWLVTEAYRFPIADLEIALLPARMIRTVPEPAVFLVLVLAVAVDAIRGVVAIDRPGFWTWWYHGREHQDCGGLLRRAGGVWAGMALAEFLVLVLFRGAPSLLLLVVGIRCTDVLPPFFYVFSGRRVAFRGYCSVAFVTLFNLLAIVFLAVNVST